MKGTLTHNMLDRLLRTCYCYPGVMTPGTCRLLRLLAAPKGRWGRNTSPSARKGEEALPKGRPTHHSHGTPAACDF